MSKSQLEKIYQREVKENIEKKFSGILIDMHKSSIWAPQGWPDWTLIFVGGKVAFLEIKRERDADRQPNQEYYVRELNRAGFFASFVYPENEKQVMLDLKDFLYGLDAIK